MARHTKSHKMKKAATDGCAREYALDCAQNNNPPSLCEKSRQGILDRACVLLSSIFCSSWTHGKEPTML